VKKAKRPTKKSKPRAKVSARKPATKKQPAKKQQPAKKKSPVKKKPAAPSKALSGKWAKFVEQHGVVLASARGSVPSVAEAIVGEPIIGSWWSHPKAHAIFDALSAIDDSIDVRCFKLVDKKITFVHRRLWPALAKLAAAGVLPADRVESIQQEHMPTGEHRNFTTPFPDWVPDDVMRASENLSIDDARDALGLR
jgi:hypothetical protein